jgi:hypothetical protein
MSNAGKTNFFFMMTTLPVPITSTHPAGIAFYALLDDEEQIISRGAALLKIPIWLQPEGLLLMF